VTVTARQVHRDASALFSDVVVATASEMRQLGAKRL
jgi:hypothetical protein